MNVTTMCKLIEDKKVVSIDDYHEKIYWDGNIIDKEDLIILIEDSFENNKEISNYVAAAVPIENFVKVDLERVIEEKCEDGYEDMKDYFDYYDEKLIKAQRLINEWLDDHSWHNTVHYEGTAFLIDIQPLIDKYRK